MSSKGMTACLSCKGSLEVGEADSSGGTEQMGVGCAPSGARSRPWGIAGGPFAAGWWRVRLAWTPQPALLPSPWTGRSGAPAVTPQRGGLKHGRQLCTVSAQAFASGFSDCIGGGGGGGTRFRAGFPWQGELPGVLCLVGPVGRSPSQRHGRPAAPDSAWGCPAAGRGGKAVRG